MKKLIIVEDEPIMSDYLASFIDWSDIGVEVVGVFNNGIDGLDAIIKTQPDIVITDIKMPQMDGLTMIEKMVSRGIKSKTLVLSAYSEFDLVKGAFHLGASDYILKPEIDENELKNTVSRLIADKSGEGDYKGRLIDLIYKQNVIKDIVFGASKLVDCRLPLRITEKNISVTAIRFLDYDEILKKEWEQESELLKYGILNVCEEMLGNQNSGEAVLNKDDELMIILSSSEDTENSAEFTENTVKQISAKIEDVFGFKTGTGFFGFRNSAAELKNMYNKAAAAAEYTFVCGRNKIVNYSDACKNCEIVDFGKGSTLFLEKLENDSFDEACDIIDEYITEACSLVQLGDLREFCDDCCFGIAHKEKQCKLPAARHTEYKKIMSSQTINELKKYFKSEIERMKENENVALVPRVKKYIEERYFEDINLEIIAEKFGVSYQKLSREFKSKTNTSPKKYLIEVRMNEAMKLIQNSDYMLYEIAEMVGYANYENFCRMFYNCFGKRPSDIKRP